MRIFAPALLGLLLAGCTAETFSPAVPDRLEVVAGAAQRGVLGLPLDTLIRVRVLGSDGRPLPGIPVRWDVTGGGGTLSSVTDATGPDGEAVASWTLGLGAEAQRINVSSLDLPSLTITADAPLLLLDRLSTGESFACGIDHAGATWCWGDNWGGTIGDSFPYHSLTPRRIGGDSFHLIEVSAGSFHACGRSVAGDVKCWGADDYGELGDGRTGSFGTGSGDPIHPIGLPPLASLDAADLGTCGLDGVGALWCWGNGGGLPRGSLPTHLFTGTSFTRISLGAGFGCGIRNDQRVVCWGQNDIGQLGQGPVGGRSDLPVPIAAPILATQLDAGDYGACAISTTRELWCWGEIAGIRGHWNGAMALGTPTRSSDDSPALRLSLGGVCGAIWHGPGSPRLLCSGWTRDIEGFSGITDVSVSLESFCLRVGDAATSCKSYSDAAGPPPFAFTGTGIPAP